MQSDGTYPAGRLNVAKDPYALLYGDDIQGMGRKSWGKTAGIYGDTCAFRLRDALQLPDSGCRDTDKIQTADSEKQQDILPQHVL